MNNNHVTNARARKPKVRVMREPKFPPPPDVRRPDAPKGPQPMRPPADQTPRPIRPPADGRNV